MASAHPHDHSGHIKLYGAVFTFLTVMTLIECLPLFGLVHISAVVLLIFSLIKFIVVVLFFMHLWGDKAINWRLFFIPLGMATVTVMVLMSLFSTWSLNYQTTARGSDTDQVAARYASRHDGECNSWVVSGFTGNTYCSSPAIGWSNQAAYDAFLVKAAEADPDFDGFDAKSADDKKALLMKKGEEVYAGNCQACHQADGKGTPTVFPPLAGDPVANGGSPEEHITIVLNGLSGKVINGVSYAAAMTPFKQLTNEQIAAVVTYERNSWGNAGGVVEPAQVQAVRGK